MSQSTEGWVGWGPLNKPTPEPNKIYIAPTEDHLYNPQSPTPAQGVKFDDDKIRMELLPPEFLTSTASILTFGAKKYDDRDWEQGMDWSRVYGALQRHLNAWWAGEHTDPETGKSHLWHANCCMAFLTTYEMRGVGTDDRPYPKEGFGNG